MSTDNLEQTRLVKQENSAICRELVAMYIRKMTEMEL